MDTDEVTKATYSPEEVADIIRELGYKAKLERGEGISSIESGVAGQIFHVYLYHKQDDRNSIHALKFTMFTSHSTNLREVNRLNDDGLRVKFVMDDDGDLKVEMFVPIVHVAPKFIAYCFLGWVSEVEEIDLTD